MLRTGARRPGSRSLSTAGQSGVVAEAATEAVVRVRNVIETAFDHAHELLTVYPLRTNAVVSGALCTLGDALAQVRAARPPLAAPCQPMRARRS